MTGKRYLVAVAGLIVGTVASGHAAAGPVRTHAGPASAMRPLPEPPARTSMSNARLPMTPPARPRALPVLNGANPCATAPCQTSDHRRGAACCRDLQIEIMCTNDESRLEALVRSRRSPYLCKVERPGDFSLEAEMISACGYLDDDGIACTLHGRVRTDGRPAGPDLCSEWPPKNRGLHPGCVFAPRRRR